MKKTDKLLKSMTTIIFCLISIIFIVISFVGIYFKVQGKAENIVPEFTLGTDLYGVMEYRFHPDSSEVEKNIYVDKEGNFKGEVAQEASEALEENIEIPYEVKTKIVKANEDKVLTKENFEKVKEIIEKRFNKFGIVDYAIRMDTTTGDAVIELSRNNERSWSTILFGDSEVQLNKSLYMFDGKFRITDHQTGVELLDNSHVTNAYSEAVQVSETGYVVYLQLELNKEGVKLLKDISNKYTSYINADGTQATDLVDISIDQLLLASTYFPEEYDRQILSIPISGELNNTTDIKNYAETANMLAEIINIGELPVTYEFHSQLFIKSDVNENLISVVFGIIYVLLVIISIVLIVKFRKSGLVAAILNAGFVALVTLVLRFLNITISINSLMTLFVVIALNVMFTWIFLVRKNEENGFLEAFKKYYTSIIPVIVIAFVFTFSTNEAISGIGNVLFWALLIQVIYNFVFTRFSIND